MLKKLIDVIDITDLIRKYVDEDVSEQYSDPDFATISNEWCRNDYTLRLWIFVVEHMDEVVKFPADFDFSEWLTEHQGDWCSTLINY